MAVKIAFTGTGYISQIHAMAAQVLPDVELVAVVNHRQESMTKFADQFDITRQYTTIPALLSDGGVDAVVISTPNYLHASEAIAILEAGVHVMVEKPMAMNTLEALQMLEASQKTSAQLMVAHCWRFDEEVLWLKKQIGAGRLGKIIRTKGYGVHVNWGPGNWFVDSQFAGGGALADMGIHAIDTVRFLMGDPMPTSVYAKITTEYGRYDVDDTGMIWINWDNGVISIIETGWWQPHADGPEASTQLYGQEGFGQVFPTLLKIPDKIKQDVEIVDSGFSPTRDPHCPQSMYDSQMAYFIQCVESNTTPTPGGLEGLINMKIVDAAYKSSKTGKLEAV